MEPQREVAVFQGQTPAWCDSPAGAQCSSAGRLIRGGRGRRGTQGDAGGCRRAAAAEWPRDLEWALHRSGPHLRSINGDRPCPMVPCVREGQAKGNPQIQRLFSP